MGLTISDALIFRLSRRLGVHVSRDVESYMKDGRGSVVYRAIVPLKRGEIKMSKPWNTTSN